VNASEKTRAEWLAERRKSIGGSDAPSILGLTKWGSPLSVWQDKRGLVPDQPASERLAMGRDLEPMIARRFAKTSGMEIVTAPESMRDILQEVSPHLFFRIIDDQLIVRNPVFPYLHATPDGLCWDTNGEVLLWEAKTVEVWWKDEWKDGAPDHVLLQAKHNALVLGLANAAVCAWIGLAEDFKWQRVTGFSEQQATEHIEDMADFWQLVINEQEPTATAGDSIPRPEDEGKTGPFPDEWLDEDLTFYENSVTAAEIKAKADEFKAKIKQHMNREGLTTLILPNGDKWAWAKNGLRRKETNQ